MAWHGDTVVIIKDGEPYLNLLPHVDTSRARKPGRLKGKIRISADFQGPPEDAGGFGFDQNVASRISAEDMGQGDSSAEIPVEARK
jgi:antitoxin (DNA-binding transcriptional repressor) of toxin-antitoxin stability system